MPGNGRRFDRRRQCGCGDIVIAALWVALATAIAIAAARRLKRAQALVGAAQTMRSLLDAAPVRARLVHSDNRIEVDQRLVRELGLQNASLRMDELAGDDAGFDRDDLMVFIPALDDVRFGAAQLTRQLRLAGRERAVEFRAALAPPPAKPDASWCGCSISTMPTPSGSNLPIVSIKPKARWTR